MEAIPKRTHMRRFTRLTSGFSKKSENHLHMVALYTVFYNFCKIHETLRVTPAIEADRNDLPENKKSGPIPGRSPNSTLSGPTLTQR